MSELVSVRTVSGEPAVIPEVLPAEAIIMGYKGLPDGYWPPEPIPAGFVLHEVLTTSELENSDRADEFAKESQRLRMVYGGDNVTTKTNTGISWTRDPNAIALARFMRHDAEPLPRLTRIRRSLSRTAFGLKCDVNF